MTIFIDQFLKMVIKDIFDCCLLLIDNLQIVCIVCSRIVKEWQNLSCNLLPGHFLFLPLLMGFRETPFPLADHLIAVLIPSTISHWQCGRVAEVDNVLSNHFLLPALSILVCPSCPDISLSFHYPIHVPSIVPFHRPDPNLMLSGLHFLFSIKGAFINYCAKL